jgi:hypothetical protein
LYYLVLINFVEISFYLLGQHKSNCCHSPHLKKFPDTAMKLIIGVVILKTVLFSFLHNMFKLLPINGHNMKKDKQVSKKKRFVKCGTTKIMPPGRPLGLPASPVYLEN